MPEGAHPSTLRKAALICAKYDKASLVTLDPSDYAWLDISMAPVSQDRWIEEAFTVAGVVIDQADQGARDWGLPHGLALPGGARLRVPESYLALFNKHFVFREYIDKIAVTRALGRGGNISTRNGNVSIWGDEYTAVLSVEGEADNFLMTYDQVLMFKDMYLGRANVFLGSPCYYNDPALSSLIHECFDWCFSCLTRYGNKGYGILKEIEAVVKVSIGAETDTVLEKEPLYGRIRDVVIGKEKKLGASTTFLVDNLLNIVKGEMPNQHRVELFGLQKLSGHPLIDPADGGESVKEEARAKINYSPYYCQRVRNNFMRMYIEGYIRRRGEWPPLTFDQPGRSSRAFQLYSRNETNISLSSYDFMELTHARFQKDHDFNYFENFTDLMDDKSLSYYRSDAHCTWDKRVKPRSHRRLLLELLNKPDVSIRDIVMKVCAGDIPFDWLIVTLYPKEREFKINARMFSMMVFEMRAFFTATEANLADNIFPYLPPQTMTLSRQEIQELFHQTTRETDRPDWIRLFGEFDVERWNLHFHPEFTDVIGNDLNDLHGLPGAFTTVHHFFKQCLILVRVNACKPDNVEQATREDADLSELESGLLWGNHEVGFEGIFQKGWTIATYAMIDLGMHQFGHHYYLIGQADNQIILMYLPAETDHNRARMTLHNAEEILEAVSRECNQVGHSLKLDECIYSTSTITYSKNVYINGVEHFTSLKAISRMFPHSASDFPTISHSVGAIAGQALAAAEVSKNPMCAFQLSVIQTAVYLRSLTVSWPVEMALCSRITLRKLTLPTIYAALILPGELGGLDIAPVTHFFYKGGADPLSKAYASLSFYQRRSKIVRRMINMLHSPTWVRRETDLRGLIDDPYSIPIVRPKTAEMSVLSRSKRKVEAVTKNVVIKELLSTKVTCYEDCLYSHLASVRPMNPVILSDIFSWSLAGISRQIGKMFTSTQTIQALLQGDNEMNPCYQILTSSTGALSTLMYKLSRMADSERCISSVYKDVCELRKSWDLGGGGEICGVTSYTPFEHTLSVSMSPDWRAGVKGYLAYHVGTAASFVRGESDPYMGRATREKRSEHGYRIITSSAPDVAVEKLSRIAVQPGVGTSMKQLIAAVTRSRANVDLIKTLPYLGEVYGGATYHRYSSRLGLRGAYGLGSMTVASNSILSTDDARPISGGEEDYPKMVQEDMLMCVSALQITSHCSDARLYATIVYSPDELAPFQELEMMAADVTPLPDVTLTGNRMAYSPHVYLEATLADTRTVMVGRAKDMTSSTTSCMYALRRIIVRALERSHTALVIADKSSGTIRLNIDILELRGVTVRGAIEMMALEVARFAICHMFTVPGDDPRW